MFESLFSRGGLSLDRLRSFLEVAQAGTIAKAASGDASRQALISRQIRELEEFFAAELTTRRGKTLVLSAAGQRLAHLIQEQFQDLNDFHLEQRSQAKTFSIGAGASVLEWLVIPAADKLRQALGNPALRFSSDRSRDLVEDVRDGRLDFAIVREDAIPQELPKVALLRVKFFICAPRNIFGTRAKGQLDNAGVLKSLPFAAMAGGGQLDTAFRRAMTQTCGEFKPAYECDSLLQVRELVLQGACAGLLPSIGTQGLADQLVMLREFGPLKDYGRALALHWNERQMRRRGVEDRTIQEVCRVLSRARAS